MEVPFEFEKLGIDGVILVKPKVFGDNRGFFMECYKKSEFAKNGIETEFVQDNHSKSSKGVLRGLHYQATPKHQAKLVKCIKGCVFDVVVDLRKNSDTFGKWLKVELSEENKNMLYIPEGFAHGFLTLSDEAELLYKTNTEFSPEHDRGLLWNDETINIDWGISELTKENPAFEPILSDKDKIQPKLQELNKEELL